MISSANVISSFQAIVVLAAGIAAFTASYLIYRTTIPPVSHRLRLGLMLLRGTALWIIFALLGEPVLSLVFRSEEPPATLLLIDNSQSMTLGGGQGDRTAQLHSVLNSDSFKRLTEIGNVETVLFAADARPVSSLHVDSLTLDGEHSDLAGALQTAGIMAASRNIQSIVMISDGNPTMGGSPLPEAEKLPVPLFTVSIGDSSEQRDILIRKVLTNTVVYAGTKVPVRVHVLSSGFEAGRVEVVLKQGTVVLDREFLALQEGTHETPVTLEFTPDKEGRQQFTVEVSQRPEEITASNNRSVFFTKVLKSRVNVLLVAAGPGPDAAFIRRHLERDNTVHLTTLFERSPDRFYEGTLTRELLDQQECIVLIGIPGPATSASTLAMLREAAMGGKGLLFVPARTIDPVKLKTLEPVLPVSVQDASPEEIQAFVHVPESRILHALLKVSEVSTPADWSRLPPLFVLRGLFRAKPESEILAVAKVQTLLTQDPLVALRNVNRRKSLALLGYGVWRWQMMNEGSHLEKLLANSVRWLALREDSRPVRVEPTKDVFTTQEPVEFTAVVNDESFQPVDDAQVTVVVSGQGERSEMSLSSLGNGYYLGRLGPFPPGDYAFLARIARNSTLLTEERGSFSVGGIRAEFLDTRTNTSLLRQLAAKTGGSYFDVHSIDRLPRVIEAHPAFRSREVTRADTVELWNTQWILGLLVALVSFEWFLRKRKGML